MSQRLSLADSRVIFDELAQALPKQHLRHQFRKRFGTGELLGPEMLKRGTVVADRERPVSNLLQETPAKISCVRLSGTADEPAGVSWTTETLGTIGELLSADEVEQGLIVSGRTAKLYAYADPTEGTVLVVRIAVEPAYEEKAKPKVKRSRSGGKATARSSAPRKSISKPGRKH